MIESLLSFARRLLISIAPGMLVVSIALAQVRPGPAPPPWLKAWTPPQVPANYRSPSGPHKIVVPGQQADQLAAVRRAGPTHEFQYRGRTIFVLSREAFGRLAPEQLQRLNVRDDYNLIRLRDRFFDTTVPQDTLPAGQRLVPRTDHQLHLIQFAGPIQDDWLAQLRRIVGLEIVTYMAENAYLVWADQAGRDELAALVNLQPRAQWEGPFHPAYKVHPSFHLGFSGSVRATIQLFTHRDLGASIAAIRARADSVLKDARQMGIYTNITVQIQARELENIARLEDVTNIEPFIEPRPLDERQGQILAGALNAAGTGPGAPGYLAWLNGLGFTTNFGFAVDITDDGFDRGAITAANVHPDLLDGAGNSRVTYVRRVDGTTIATTNDNNPGGHGTINASIVGGLNTTAVGAANFLYFGDANGFRYGLGIAPFAMVGSTRVLDPWSFPDYTTVIDAAHSSGARISNNSWGLNPGTGTYDVASQEYDGLVRDARPGTAPSGGILGNQEMVIVFAAGNAGPGGSTIGDFGGTAKNTITVGASETFNAAGATDGCGITSAGANNINQVINFSSRGPTIDGRRKPDIMAPGTQIYGAASQDPGFNGSSVCGSATNDFVAPPADAYFPPDPNAADAQAQTLYTWSSGTSHAAPAVAGGAALLRQWFLDRGHPAPSPAMTKAYLINGATYMTGPADNLYSNVQGMGRMNLGMAFDNVPRLLFDQVKTAHDNGTVDASEVFTVNGQVVDATRPFRVTLAYTDAPGTPGAGVITNNDLDLEVQVGGNFYRGNNFTLGVSNVGLVTDPPDNRNNVESVFLPAGTTGDFTVTVRPTNINSDGVPNNGDATDQDFALVIYNADFPARNPVDIILVLDVSGSMNSPAAGGTANKIDLLKDAVDLFVRTWEPFSIPADRLGVVYFSSGIAGTFPAATPTLVPFQANASAIIADVRARTASGCTALGGGILRALRGFDALPDRQRHIVVFTNGMQNRSPMVTSVGAAHQILDDAGAGCGSSGVAAEPGVNLGDYGVKAIHTIGTGATGATWTDLIAAIASETGGQNHFTSTPDENLEDFFLETLVAALRVDPVEKVRTATGVLTNSDSGKAETFEINATTRRATFAVTWRGDRRSKALDFTLVAPNGTTVPTSLITFRDGPFYRIASVALPLAAAPAIPHAGTWRLVFQPRLQVSQVSYRVHLIVDDADLRYRIDIPTAGNAVGEPIPLSVWAQQGNRTLTGLRDVWATVDRPAVGLGTFLSRHSVSQARLDQAVDLSGDQFANRASKKGFLLFQDPALRRELDPVTDRIQLFDDGLAAHGDAKENDGVYSALYTNTQRPGFYAVALSFRTAGTEPAARTEATTLSVGIEQFDLTRSTIDIRPAGLPEGGTGFLVRAILIDQYDNYLGPGYSVAAVVALPGQKGAAGRRVLLADNLDGSYSALVAVTPAEVAAGARIRIEVGNNAIALVPFGSGATTQRFAFSAHGGITQPLGTFNNTVDAGTLFEIDLARRIAPELWLELVAGRYQFKPSYEVSGLTLYLKRYVPLSSFRFYGAAGAGAYKPENLDAVFGLSAMLGVLVPVTPRFGVEAGASYFHLFAQGEATRFVGYKAGVRWTP